jgi:DNA-binding MarR family transcriptional regulator
MPQGRDPKDLGVLVTVEAAGPLTQRKLGDLLGVNRTTMVKIADSLEGDGLLRRERDPADRRNYAVSITAEGRAAIAEMTRRARLGDAELTSALTGPERARLVGLLQRIVPDLIDLIPGELTGLSAFLIARAHLRLRAEVSVPLSPLGIATHQFGLLTALESLQPCSQQRVATALGISGPAVVSTVAELEKRELITRERNPEDRREHLLRLTPEGLERVTAARSIVDVTHDELARRVGTAELSELNALLAKITA